MPHSFHLTCSFPSDVCYCCFYLSSSPCTIISLLPLSQASSSSREALCLVGHSILNVNVMTDDLFIWILYVWSLCLSWSCSSWAKNFSVGPGQTNLPSLTQENFLVSLFSPYYINHSQIRAVQTHILNGFISPYSLGLFCCTFSFALLSDWKVSPLPSSLPIFFLSSSHLTHAFPKLTTVSLIGSPQKICQCPNPWDLWIWPYLDKKKSL